MLKALFRILTQEEQLLAFLETATSYQFVISSEKTAKKDAPYWVCVTTTRVFVLAAALIGQTLYQHHLEFQQDFVVELKEGKFSDTYIFRDAAQELRLQSAMFHSANLKKALKAHLLRPETSTIS